MDVTSAGSANETLFLAAMRSEKQQQAAILQVVAQSAEQAAQVAKSAPAPGVGQNVDVST